MAGVKKRVPFKQIKTIKSSIRSHMCINQRSLTIRNPPKLCYSVGLIHISFYWILDRDLQESCYLAILSLFNFTCKWSEYYQKCHTLYIIKRGVIIDRELFKWINDVSTIWYFIAISVLCYKKQVFWLLKKVPFK